MLHWGTSEAHASSLSRSPQAVVQVGLSEQNWLTKRRCRASRDSWMDLFWPPGRDGLARCTDRRETVMQQPHLPISSCMLVISQHCSFRMHAMRRAAESMSLNPLTRTGGLAATTN